MLFHAARRGLNRRDHLERVLHGCSYQKILKPGRILRERLEHLRDGGVLESLAAHIPHHANDCKPRPAGVCGAELESPAEWVAAWPQAAGHHIIDDRYARRIRSIG